MKMGNGMKKNMGKVIPVLIITVVLLALAWYSVSQAAELSFEWDANTESDLVGYRLYQSDTPDGQTTGGESSPNFVVGVLAGAEAVTITVAPTEDVTLYWVLTAYDTADLESGKSNEVSHYFNVVPPAPPGTLQKTNVQAANVYVNGDVHVAEVNVDTLRMVQRKE